MSGFKHYSWSALNRFGVQLIGFVGNILIARQLTPDDYGLVAMLSIFMGIAWNFTESGFADYLIAKADADEKDFSTVFSHNILISLFLYTILYFSAPYIATFFDRTELIEITRILGLSIILKAITLSEFTRMRKELLFKNSALIQLVSSLVAVLIAYTMALYGFGYWAIVFQTLVIAIVNLFMIILINRWWPKFKFDWNRYKQMRVFSNNMLLSYLTNQIGQNINSVFIGKFHSTNLLGFYNQAVKINDAGFQGINAVILTTSYPILSKEKDKERRKNMYDKVLNHFLFIQFILCFLIIGSANPLIEILFGAKWLQTAPYLQLLTLTLLLYPLTTLNSNIIKIEGLSGLYRNLTFLRNGLNLLALLITFQYSVESILLGQLIARQISILVDVFVCGKLIAFHPVQQFRIVANQLLAPIIGMFVAYFSAFYVLQIHLKFTVYAFVYIFVVFIINKGMKNFTQQYYLDKFSKLIKKTQ